MGRKLTIEEVKARLPEHITIDESTYTKVTAKARFIDSEYGEWWALTYSVLQGRGNPDRGNVARSKIKIISIEYIKSKLPEYITIDEKTYKDSSTKCRFIDKDYGEWWVVPYCVLKGVKHPRRSLDNNAKKRIHSAQDIQKQLPDFITIDESTYIKTHLKARFIDRDYGEWWSTPDNVLRGRRHPNRKHPISNLEQIIINELNILKFNEIIIDNANYRPDFKLSDNLYLNTDGLYWHSDQSNRNNEYHFKLRKDFEDNNLQILQFRTDEIENKLFIIKSIIDNKLGKSQNIYYARKLEIKVVDNKTAQKFLQENHLMGGYKTAKYIGLYDKDELVSIMGYKKKDTGIDISRFCNKLNTVIVGGLSKLLKYIEKTENPKSIQSWVDLRYGNGKSLETIGFSKVKDILGWCWTDGSYTYNRLCCRANMDKRRLSEKEYAKEFKWFKIYDAGQRLYIKYINRI